MFAVLPKGRPGQGWGLPGGELNPKKSTSRVSGARGEVNFRMGGLLSLHPLSIGYQSALNRFRRQGVWVVVGMVVVGVVVVVLPYHWSRQVRI
jgi:hypothetical protein